MARLERCCRAATWHQCRQWWHRCRVCHQWFQIQRWYRGYWENNFQTTRPVLDQRFVFLIDRLPLRPPRYWIFGHLKRDVCFQSYGYSKPRQGFDSTKPRCSTNRLVGWIFFWIAWLKWFCPQYKAVRIKVIFLKADYFLLPQKNSFARRLVPLNF